MRLTKNENGLYVDNNCIVPQSNDIITKLGQLEDVLEKYDMDNIKKLSVHLELLREFTNIKNELGIDLLILFKALKNGIWVKYDANFGFTGKPKIVIEKDKCTEICLRKKKWWIQENDFLLKDYGKTWALTKEELL